MNLHRRVTAWRFAAPFARDFDGVARHVLSFLFQNRSDVRRRAGAESDEQQFNRHKSVLDAMGDQAAYIGPIGAGTIAKLVHNAAGYAIHCAVAEVFTMGVKAGVEPLALWSAIRQGALGRKRTFERMADQFLQGKFEPPDFALNLAFKDVTLATELAREIGVPMRLVTLAHAEMAEAVNRGWGAKDSRVFLLLQEERAKVEIKVPAADIQAVIDKEG